MKHKQREKTMKKIMQTAVAQIQPLLDSKKTRQWSQQAVAFVSRNWFRLIVIYLLITISATLNDISDYTASSSHFLDDIRDNTAR
jgi:ABC-type phosphate/phosphonate transport system permease subunit